MFQIDFEQIQKDAKRKIDMQEQIVELAKSVEPNHAYAVIVGTLFAHMTLDETEKAHLSMMQYVKRMWEVKNNG